MGMDVARLDRRLPLDALGLDSLMALELKNQVEKRWGVDLPLVELLRGPTIEGLAEWLQAQTDNETAETATHTPAICPITDPHHLATTRTMIVAQALRLAATWFSPAAFGEVPAGSVPREW